MNCPYVVNELILMLVLVGSEFENVLKLADVGLSSDVSLRTKYASPIELDSVPKKKKEAAKKPNVS